LKILPLGFGESYVARAHSGEIILNADELFRLRIRQRTQQRGFNHTENRGCRSNAIVNTAVVVNPEDLRSIRRPKRTSCIRMSMKLPAIASRHSSLNRSWPPTSLRRRMNWRRSFAHTSHLGLMIWNVPGWVASKLSVARGSKLPAYFRSLATRFFHRSSLEINSYLLAS